jgi:hypothetical protein
MIVNEFGDLIREGYPQDSFYGDEDEWTKDGHIETTVGHFFRLDRLCVSRNSEFRLRMFSELHNNSLASHIEVACTLTKALDRSWCKRIRHDDKVFCERCVVCRRAKI